MGGEDMEGGEVYRRAPAADRSHREGRRSSHRADPQSPCTSPCGAGCAPPARPRCTHPRGKRPSAPSARAVRPSIGVRTTGWSRQRECTRNRQVARSVGGWCLGELEACVLVDLHHSEERSEHARPRRLVLAILDLLVGRQPREQVRDHLGEVGRRHPHHSRRCEGVAEEVHVERLGLLLVVARVKGVEHLACEA
jgi:hypothetical protein